MPKLIENVKPKIIEEARKVFLSGSSYKQMNIRDIAKNCGIGIGTFYNYFANKEELAIEIFKADWEKTLNLIEELQGTDESLKEKLRKVYLSLESFIDQFMAIFREIANEEGYEKRQSYSYHQFFVKLQELLEAERQKGTISSPLDSQKLSYLIGSNFMYLSKLKYMSYDELFEHLKI